MKFILSYDVETTGSRIGHNNLLAVGFVVAIFHNDKYEVLDSIEVHIENDVLVFGKGTKEFWDKNPEAFHAITQNTQDKKTCANLLIDFIKKYQQMAFDKKSTFIFLTDNAWFDNSWINWFLCTYGDDGYPIRYNYIDVDEFNEPKYMGLDKCVDLNQRIRAIKGDINQTDFNISNDTAPVPPIVPNEEHKYEHTPITDTKEIIQKYWEYCTSSKLYRKRSK